MRPERFDAVVVPLLCLGAGICCLWRLGSAPPPGWDEGWTLAAARHWVERGHYGRLLLGEPAPATLVHGVSVTGPVAAAFSLFGVGFWQGRLFGVVCLGASSLLLFALARRLFDRATAWATLLLAVVSSPMPDANTIQLSRQVLGEVPMLTYLLGGLLCLHSALRASVGWVVPALALLAAAVLAKPQLQIFLAAAMAAAVVHALVAADRRAAVVLAGTAALALTAAAGVNALRPRFLPGFFQESFDTMRLYRSTVMVVDAPERLCAARLLALYALPSLIGIAFGLLELGRRLRGDRGAAFVRTAWLCLALGWVGWFAFLGAAWPRYLFPAVYLASPFVADFLVSWWRRGNPARRRLAAAVGLAALALGGRALLAVATQPAETSVVDAARWINSQTPADAVVESYESALLFLLDRPYHHPPVDVHVRMIEIARNGRVGELGYEARAAEAAYLVVGPFADMAVLYRPERWGFHQTQRFGPYRIFEPNR